MTATPAVRPSRILTIVPLGLILGTLGVVVFKVTKPVVNPDTYFHLRLGHEFLNGWSAKSPESVTRFATADWVPTQWLGQVGLASAENAFGLPGVVAVTTLSVLAMALVFFLTARRQGSLVIAAALAPMAVLACSPALSGRPQVFSYMFTALLTSTWLDVRRTGKVPWWTIPLVWLWAMTHGMWSVAVIVGAVAAVGLALERPPTLPKAWKLVAVPALSVIAAALTPVGPALFDSVVRVGSISHYFAEWGPPDFTTPTDAVAALMLILMLVSALRGGPMPWTVMALTLLAGAWLLYSARTVPVGVSMLVPLVSHHFRDVLPHRERSRAERPVIAVGFVAALVATVVLAPAQGEDRRATSLAHASVDTLPARTALLNEWGEGGYDMWRHRDLDIMLHGYGDMFTDDELKRNVDVADLSRGWHKTIQDLDITHALLYWDSPLTITLVDDHGWRVVAKDALVPASEQSGREEDQRLVHIVAPEGDM